MYFLKARVFSRSLSNVQMLRRASSTIPRGKAKFVIENVTCNGRKRVEGDVRQTNNFYLEVFSLLEIERGRARGENSTHLIQQCLWYEHRKDNLKLQHSVVNFSSRRRNSNASDKKKGKCASIDQQEIIASEGSLDHLDFEGSDASTSQLKQLHHFYPRLKRVLQLLIPRDL